ncbi:MAG: TonB-dependent receptor [Gammaproteobacteria bacterium]|nr:TonB-dependent receptor [Gammaproteobacteria bacterium]
MGSKAAVLTSPLHNLPFDPEFVWAFEVGLKSDWLQRRLRMNFAAFVYDYQDLQVRVPASAVSVSIENAATAEIWGAEVEFIIKPSAAFQIEGNVAYLDAKYNKFSVPADFDQITGAPITDASGNIILQSLGGNRLNRSPKWQISLAAQYVWAFDNWGDITLRGSFQSQSSVFFTEQNNRLLGNSGWDNFDARLIFESRDEAWQINIFGKNLADDRYISNVVDVNPLLGGFVNLPRRWGISVRYRY